MKSNFKKVGVLLIVGLAIAAWPASAYVMSSTHYRVERDSVNFGGGLGASADYSVQSTIGEAGTGPSASSTAKVFAGYQQYDGSFVSMSVPTAVTLLPQINSGDGGAATGSSSIIINTNNAAGYTLTINAATSPALKSGSSAFVDYVPLSAVPDYVWQTSSSINKFGFSPEGADTVSRYRDNGSVCNIPAGSDTAGTCWDGLSTSPLLIGQSSSANNPTGATTTLEFKAEAKPNSGLTAGSYAATITLTATAN